MKFMKTKLWSLLLVMAAALSMASCSSGGGGEADDVMGSKPDPVYGEGEAIKADAVELSWLISNSPVILVNSVYLDKATSSERSEFKKAFGELCTIAEHFKVPEKAATRGWLGITADVVSFCEHLGKPAAIANQELYEMLRQAYGKAGEEQLNKKLWNMALEYVPQGYDFVDFTKDIVAGKFNHPGLLSKIYVDETFLTKLEDYSVNLIRHKYLAETTAAVAEDAMSIVMDAAPGDLVGASATTYKILKAVQGKKKEEIIKAILSAVNSDIDDLYNIQSLKNSISTMIDITEQKHFDYPINKKSLFEYINYQEVGTDYVWAFFDDPENPNISTRYVNYGKGDLNFKLFYTVLSGEHLYIKRGDRYDAYDIVQTLGSGYKEIMIKLWKAGTYNPMEYMTLVKYEYPADIIGTWRSILEDREGSEEVIMEFTNKGKFTITINLKWFDDNSTDTNKIWGDYKLDGRRVYYTVTKSVEGGVDTTSKITEKDRTGSFYADVDENDMTIRKGDGDLGTELARHKFHRK